MIWATVVQHYIYKTNVCGDRVATCVDGDGNALVSSLNIWIQTGSYVLLAFSEIMASITGLEYTFTKAPKSMRSLVMALFLFMSAIASALGEAFVTLSTDPLLVLVLIGARGSVEGIELLPIFWWLCITGLIYRARVRSTPQFSFFGSSQKIIPGPDVHL
ncbi:hypothetical protein FB45DRAFT_1107035 [Roridomyces roridus]|uniref:Uncharacterized protein n=1 Tax=Roridomyces roridus TaxID=1738132 RepID=A0AAD7FCR6_9AGAR|nr:hypothetical protein FB45DRAFT_1107035 [Roridomyces roridus]